MGADIFGDYHITYIDGTGKSTGIHLVTIKDKDEALQRFHTIKAKWLIAPLLSWCKQQEHQAAVLQISYANRKEHIYKLTRLVKAFVALPVITQVQLADFLQYKALPLLENAFPGKTSKYFDYTNNLRDYLQQHANNILQQPISGNLLQKEIPTTRPGSCLHEPEPEPVFLPRFSQI